MRNASSRSPCASAMREALAVPEQERRRGEREPEADERQPRLQERMHGSDPALASGRERHGLGGQRGEAPSSDEERREILADADREADRRSREQRAREERQAQLEQGAPGPGTEQQRRHPVASVERAPGPGE